VHGDTSKVLFGMGTYGSRSIAVGGTAIMKAIDKIVVVVNGEEHGILSPFGADQSEAARWTTDAPGLCKENRHSRTAQARWRRRNPYSILT
jgi:CO/xanthine dehydrogenase Mo-binding subunit